MEIPLNNRLIQGSVEKAVFRPFKLTRQNDWKSEADGSRTKFFSCIVNIIRSSDSLELSSQMRWN